MRPLNNFTYMTELDVNSTIRAFLFTPFGAFFYFANLIMLFRCLENIMFLNTSVQ